ncbi:hypothetical protein Amet_3068 [Alkaliphilus metalliredigens QYMF]|uniref:Uncharacterized protein n=1 Tax=Alkaliphilus metalliredigens (strain QYMF) TaxID=293826 RepID=A6TSP0_ALKMQ|nr:hypothetical protein [Alkaliphilus metalliredigens]ABR49208.1 hypothetical protein Amet_3068 [Alkaliphilus metalliredigens QYMF]
MGKIFIAILILSIIVVASWTFGFFITPPASIPTFHSNTITPNDISQEWLDLYYGDDPEVKRLNQIKIIEQVLIDLQYDKWIEFKDYIQIDIYTAAVLPQEIEQVIIALTLSKDRGIVAIYSASNNGYTLHSAITNLAPVTDIQFIENPSDGLHMMVVEQLLEEQFGSFFQEKFIHVYLHDSHEFKNVWQKTLYYDEIYKQEWLDPAAPDDLWYRAIEETIIDYVTIDTLRINISTTLKKYTTHSQDFPPKDQFQLEDSDSFTRSYYWSADYNTFILGEFTQEVFLSDIAFLEDMENSREQLLGISNAYFKVMSHKGEILYLPKSKFSKMFLPSLE